jgi:hypothetical protein
MRGDCGSRTAHRVVTHAQRFHARIAAAAVSEFERAVDPFAAGGGRTIDWREPAYQHRRPVAVESHPDDAAKGSLPFLSNGVPLSYTAGKAVSPACPPTRRSRIDSASISFESCLDLPMVAAGSVCGRIGVAATAEARHGYFLPPCAA